MKKYRLLLFFAAGVLLLSVALRVDSPVRAAAFESCPNTDSLTVPEGVTYGILTKDKPAAEADYKKGYDSGCNQGVVAFGFPSEPTLLNDTCANKPLTSGAWVSGCKSGVTKGLAVQANNLSVANTSISDISKDVGKCSGLNIAQCTKGFLGRLADLTTEGACSTLNNDCVVGYKNAQSVYFGGAVSTKYPASNIDDATDAAAKAINNYCDLENYVKTSILPYQKEDSFKNGYKKGCVAGYNKAFNGWVYEDVFDPLQDSTCKVLVNEYAFQIATQNEQNFGLGQIIGCKEAVKYAWQVKPPETVAAATVGFAKSVGCSTTNSNADFQNGYYLGCFDGYKKIEADRALEKNSAINDCRIGRISTGKYVRVSDFNKGIFDGCADGVNKGCSSLSGATCTGSTNAPFANLGNNTGKGIVPNCDPKLPPSAKKGQPIKPGAMGYDPNNPGQVYQSSGCGINKLVELIKNIMNYLFIISIPIAVLAIGYGGFQIMTAAGSEEKLSGGKSAITIAVTGIVIMLASYFVVQAIFKVLGVTSSLTPGGL